MKTTISIISILLLTIFVACNKEEIFHEPLKKSLDQIDQSDLVQHPASVAKAIIDRKPMIIRTYTESIKKLPVKNDLQLLQLIADCQDRKNIARKFNMEYQALTITAEIADLKRIGMPTDQAAILHAATYLGIINTDLVHSDFIGVIDIIAGKEQTLDAGLLAIMPLKPFYQIINQFIENDCPSCSKESKPSFLQIKEWIQVAGTLRPFVSYDLNGVCSPHLSKLTSQFNDGQATLFPISTLSGTNGERKPMLTRTYFEIIDILPIKTDEDLLQLVADCKDRKRVARQYKLNYSDLTIAVEIADLKRTGMTLDQAGTIYTATYFGIERGILNEIEFVGIVDIISGREQTIDVGLLAAMPSEALYQLVIDFVKNDCSDCINSITFSQINSWIKVAEQFPLLVSYNLNGNCINRASKLSAHSNKEQLDILPYLSLPSTNNIGRKRKTMITRTYTASFDILPIKTDKELLELAANYKDRKKVAHQHKMEYSDLTIAVEVADLKRTGMTLDQAATIHAATYLGMEHGMLNEADFIGIVDLIGGREQTIDVGLLAAMPSESFYEIVIDFIKNDCSDCQEPISFTHIDNWIKVAKQLPIVVNYE